MAVKVSKTVLGLFDYYRFLESGVSKSHEEVGKRAFLLQSWRLKLVRFSISYVSF